MLGNFEWYRRWRGGRWARVSSLFSGPSWVRVTPECVERVDEDWDDPVDPYVWQKRFGKDARREWRCPRPGCGRTCYVYGDDGEWQRTCTKHGIIWEDLGWPEKLERVKAMWAAKAPVPEWLIKQTSKLGRDESSK